MSEAKRLGKVKWFDSTKGYGFITPDDGSEDLFVHQTSIHSNGFGSLAEGEAIEYTVEHENGGRTKALDVTRPDGAFVQGNSGGDGGGRGLMEHSCRVTVEVTVEAEAVVEAEEVVAMAVVVTAATAVDMAVVVGGTEVVVVAKVVVMEEVEEVVAAAVEAITSVESLTTLRGTAPMVVAAMSVGAAIISVVTLVIFPEISLTVKVMLIGSLPYLCSCYLSVYL